MKKYIHVHIKYALCQLGNFACFLIGCWFFYKIFSKASIWTTIRNCPTGSGSCSAFYWPDLSQNCLQRFRTGMSSWCQKVWFGNRTNYRAWSGSSLIWVQTFCNLNFFQKCYQSVKRYGSRSGSRSMVLSAWSGTKLFTTDIDQKIVGKGLSGEKYFHNCMLPLKFF